jgi:hypothetical protein
MPCSCQIPGPAYPENKEWGPFVWNVLHGLAERAGTVVFELYKADERRAWIAFLPAIGGMLPCSECRDHFKAWLLAHPITSIQTMPYSEIKPFVRNWLWSLHENVNTRLAKPSFPFESLTPTYGSVAINHNFKLVELIEKRAIQQGGVPLQSWLAWVKQYRTLASVYGLA